MVNVKNRWALITGASRGIGYLSALFMAKQGCNLILHSRKEEHCEKVLKEVLDLGVEAYVVAAELSDLDAVEKMLQTIDAKGTPVDIVLNNAGVQIAYRNEYLKTPVSDYEISFKINTIAPMMICYHFIPKMVERGFGRIVNTTSGIRLEPEQAGYSASKAALDKITIDIKSEGFINENACNIDFNNTKEVKKIEKKAENMINEYTNLAIAKAKKYKTDIFGFGNQIYHKYPKYYKEINDWNEIFPKLDIKINVDYKIKNIGASRKSIKSIEE